MMHNNYKETHNDTKEWHKAIKDMPVMQHKEVEAQMSPKIQRMSIKRHKKSTNNMASWFVDFLLL